MNANLAEAMAQKHQAQLDQFGEVVTFWPGGDEELEVQAIVFRSAAAESKSPGSVTRVWIRLSDFATEPVKEDPVLIGGVLFLVKDVNANTDGSADLLVRKKSATA